MNSYSFRPLLSSRLNYLLNTSANTCFFSTSSSRLQRTHYQSLGVPHNATKMEIKAKYFNLSKQYHPDMTSEPSTVNKFHEVSEAYKVLSNDRDRRAYDRKLVESLPLQTGWAGSSSSNSLHRSAYYEPSEKRRRGATNAWEHPRQYRHSGQPHTDYTYTHGPSAWSQSQRQYPHAASRASARPGTFYPDPFSSPYVRRSTGAAQNPSTPNRRPAASREERRQRESNEVSHESSLYRFMRVILLLFMISLVAGGLGSGGAYR